MRSKLSPVAGTLCLILCSLRLHAAEPDTITRNSVPAVTPVARESWLNHLHRSFGDTSMGKTGRLGPPASDQEQNPPWPPDLVLSSAHSSTVTGQDLYRVNCQGCHGEAGLGAPPEIHSVIDPVRATSAPLMLQRMKQRGMEISNGSATELAKQAQEALVERLHNGGTDMPAFSYLTEVEDHALIEYLKQLSGVPGAKQVAVNESPMRKGELIVKSTCNICHDATGPNPTAAQLEDGAIPPLQRLTTRTDESQFIRKVTSGAPILMGTPPTLHRGRMPVFYYLSAEEAADAYLYLSAYPPSPFSAATAVIAATRQDSGANPTPSDKPHSPAPLEAAVLAPVAASDGISDEAITLSLIGLGAMVLGLLCGGVGFCGYELCRLGRDREKSMPRMAAPGRPSRALIRWPSKLITPSPSAEGNKSKETIHVASS